jgi:hypothetical protein
MKHILPFALMLFVTLVGCEKKEETPKAASTEKAATVIEQKLPTPELLFGEPVTAHRFELPTEALQVWRQTRSVKPALVLFSVHPFLDRIEDERKAEVADLIRNGKADTFKKRGSFFRVNPALVSTQALSAAIENALFSEIIWILPTRASIEELSLDILRKQVTDAGFLTRQEGDKLFLAEGVASGTVRGLPFRMVHPDTLPELDKPVVVHVDTGYFKGMFKNEVATPLYDILHQTISRIMQAEWQVYSTTLSYSTVERMFSLDVRFLVTVLAKIIEDPQLLQKMPEAWQLHGDAMYIGNMYMEKKSRDVIEEAAVTAPEDPIIVYALSQVRFQQGRAKEAFTLLDKAVELDPGYGTAYLELSDTGREMGQLDKALELQRKAARIYPENPFIQINEADILIQMQKTGKAIRIIEKLQTLPWSDYYHANAVENLDNMIEYARNPQPATQAEEQQVKD